LENDVFHVFDVLTVVSLGDPVLLINHRELKGKRIPERCWKNPFKSIQVVSRDVKFSRSFKVYVDGKNINGKKGVKMKCTHTVDELKSKVTTSPWKFQLHMDTQTLKDHCTLLYYKIGQGTNITLHEVPESRMQIYLQLEVGKEQPRMVERDWTVKRLKSAISNWNGIPIRQQTLMFRGRVLPDGIRLTDYNGIKCIIQVSRPGVEWHPIMEPLELDHFGWLLARVVKQLDDEV
jgi:Ubiquitin family